MLPATATWVASAPVPTVAEPDSWRPCVVVAVTAAPFAMVTVLAAGVTAVGRVPVSVTFGAALTSVRVPASATVEPIALPVSDRRPVRSVLGRVEMFACLICTHRVAGAVPVAAAVAVSVLVLGVTTILVEPKAGIATPVGRPSLVGLPTVRLIVAPDAVPVSLVELPSGRPRPEVRNV